MGELGSPTLIAARLYYYYYYKSYYFGGLNTRGVGFFVNAPREGIGKFMELLRSAIDPSSAITGGLHVTLCFLTAPC
jgi:hypothetical protein